MGRRSFSEEFKLSAVKLVLEQGYTVAEASKSLGVDRSSLRSWLKQYGPAVGNGTSGKLSMQAELRRLREENKRLLMEREILKKATAFFAKHPS
jgi:transposase